MLNRDRYLRERAYREKRRNRNDYRDYRPEYDSRRNSYDYGYRYDFEGENMDYKQPREYGRYNDYDMRDYRRGRDMRDYRDYAEGDYDKEYEYDLEKWINKLKKQDRFNMEKEQILSTAKQMGVKFKEYDEDEFYAIYLMHVTDYPTVSNDPRMYLSMAKEWLEDKDINIDGSTKVCKYMYEIVMADED